MEVSPTLSRTKTHQLDARIDFEPHKMLTLDNTKTNNRSVSPCNFAPTCFKCPLAKCKYDTDLNINTLVYALRNKKLLLEVGRLLETGMSPYAVAKKLRIESRRVYRWKVNKLWTYFKEWGNSKTVIDVVFAPRRVADQYMVGEPQMPRI